MIPSASQYNSRSSFVNQILVAIAGRAAEEIVSGTSECTAGGTTRYCSNDTNCTYNGLKVRYGTFTRVETTGATKEFVFLR